MLLCENARELEFGICSQYCYGKIYYVDITMTRLAMITFLGTTEFQQEWTISRHEIAKFWEFACRDLIPYGCLQ